MADKLSGVSGQTAIIVASRDGKIISASGEWDEKSGAAVVQSVVSLLLDTNTATQLSSVAAAGAGAELKRITLQFGAYNIGITLSGTTIYIAKLKPSAAEATPPAADGAAPAAAAAAPAS